MPSHLVSSYRFSQEKSATKLEKVKISNEKALQVFMCFFEKSVRFCNITCPICLDVATQQREIPKSFPVGKKSEKSPLEKKLDAMEVSKNPGLVFVQKVCF